MAKDEKEVQEETVKKNPMQVLCEKYPELSMDMLTDLKAKYGRVYALPIQDRIFIYRALGRLEYQQLQMQIATQMKPKDTPEEQQGQMVEARYLEEEKVVKAATIYPVIDIDEGGKARAGTFDALRTAIMMKSHFMNPEAISDAIVEI